MIAEEMVDSAEFTPRVRLDHPTFTFDKLNPLIAAQGEKLLVRITGQQLYDSELAEFRFSI